MLRVGLTGGIACGKSVVAAMMRELGCEVLEADEVARRMTEPGGEAYADVVAAFGAGILGPERRIDRARLGAIVFADAGRREQLNRLIHPRVAEVFMRRMEEHARAEPQGVFVAVAALWAEAGYASSFDRLAVVWCRPEQQIHRLMARGLSRYEALQRLDAQLPIGDKLALADDRIDASGTLEETRAQVVRIVAGWKKMAQSAGARDAARAADFRRKS
jgi:dephospho-CoA kinase